MKSWRKALESLFKSLPNSLLELAFEVRRRYFLLRYRNLTIEPGVRIGGNLRLRGSVRVHIATGTRLRKHNRFFGSGEAMIGRDCLLNGCSIGCYSRVEIDEKCLISDCYIVDSDFHNVAPDLRHAPLTEHGVRPIHLERNVWVGSGVSVLKGVTVGENSVIGLGSVVRRPVPANVVVIGNPQQIVKHLDPAPRRIDCQEVSHATP
jgi:maltose O-acetyltransferase